MKHELEISKEDLTAKTSSKQIIDITEEKNDFKVGDTIRYKHVTKEGNTETHVFEVTEVKNVTFIHQTYLGVVD
jgi:DNA-directed RNA polymerase subunit E'/Rpb7